MAEIERYAGPDRTARALLDTHDGCVPEAAEIMETTGVIATMADLRARQALLTCIAAVALTACSEDATEPV